MDIRLKRQTEMQVEGLMQQIAVMQAFLAGRQVQVYYGGVWRDYDLSPDIDWDWDTFKYRVKPEKQ